MRQTHFYRPAEGHGLQHDPFNAIIAPRPIGWISSQTADGDLNLAPYSFFNAFNYRPPIIGFSSVGAKDTLANVQATGEFCWNLASAELAEQMNASSAELDPAEDEFQAAGLSTAESRVVAVPHVAQARAVFECRATQVVPLTTAAGDPTPATMVFGEVVGVHIDRDLLHDGVYQTAAAQPLLRAGGAASYFTLSEDHHMLMPRPAA